MNTRLVDANVLPRSLIKKTYEYYITLAIRVAWACLAHIVFLHSIQQGIA